MAEEQHWGVLGGGVLGMTLALRLAEQGRKVTLIEAADSPGGLVSPWQIDTVTWDRFYHVIISSDEHLLRVLHQIGLGDAVDWGTTRTLFYAGDGLHPLNNVFDYLRLPGLGPVDKLRLALNIVYGASVKDGARFESLSAEEWLSRISGRRTYERLWRPLLRAKLGSNEPEASAAFIWSVMRRFYGARQGKTKTESFGYVRGGYARVIAAFEAHLRERGVAFQLGAPVQNVEGHADGVDVTTEQGTQRFDKAAMTFAAPIATRVCPQLPEAERDKLNQILYQGVVCVSLLLKRPLGGAYLTYITDESLPFTTIIEMSSLVDRAQLGGNHLVYLPKYVPSHDPFLRLPDEEITAMFVDGLRRLYPDLDDTQIVGVRVARTPYVAPVMTRNFTRLIPGVPTAVPNVFMVSSAQLVHGSSSVDQTMHLVEQALPTLLSGGG